MSEQLDWKTLDLISRLLDKPEDAELVKRLWKDRLIAVQALHELDASEKLSDFAAELVRRVLEEVGEES
jgi:hypothetical protein